MIITIYGRREQGKTTLGFFLSKRKPTRVIFDPRRQFVSTVKNSAQVDSALGLYEMMDEKEEIIVQPISDVQEEFRVLTADFRDWIMDNPEEESALFVDEIRFLDTPNQVYESFEQILRFSQRDKTDIIITCHRPADLSVDIRAIADYLALFRTTQEHDLKVIRERCGEEIAEMVAALPNYHWVSWNDGTATYVVNSDPEKWFVDLKPTIGVEKSDATSF